MKRSDDNLISLGEDCFLDIEQEVIKKDGMDRALSRTMFKVLRCLIENMGSEVSISDLIRYGWGSNTTIQKDILYVVIKRIRERLEDDPKHPQCLISKYGTGYILYPRRKGSPTK